MSDVTRILSQIKAGDPQAAEKLLPLMYDEQRKLLAENLAQEKLRQTLRVGEQLGRVLDEEFAPEQE